MKLALRPATHKTQSLKNLSTAHRDAVGTPCSQRPNPTAVARLEIGFRTYLVTDLRVVLRPV
jgi:hypothetical protein